MEAIGSNRKEPLSKNTAKQDRKEADGLGRHVMEIVEVLVTDIIFWMFVENSIAIIVRVLNVDDHHQVDFFLRIR